MPQPEAGQHDSRALAVQALEHVVLDHQVPRDYAAFLEQRVEINYFAAALLIPERPCVRPRLPKTSLSKICATHLRCRTKRRHMVHQPRHASPGRPSALHASRIHRRDLQGLRERRRALSNRCHGAIEGQQVCRYWTARAVFNRRDASSAYQKDTDTTSVRTGAPLWSTGLRRDCSR
jgi:XRE family transcriptional regulator, fatty acid utilization regulator